MKTAAHCAVSVVLCAARRLTKGREHALENYWPVMGVEFSEDMLDFPALFGREAPVTLEIGLAWGRRWWQWLKIALSRTSSALKCIHRALVRARFCA